MSYNEWSFLSERITETNPETNYALLNFNSVFVNSPEGDEILRDQLLLKFKQRLWKIPDQIENEIVTPYYGMFYKQKDDQVPFLIHDLIFQDQL